MLLHPRAPRSDAGHSVRFEDEAQQETQEEQGEESSSSPGEQDFPARCFRTALPLHIIVVSLMIGTDAVTVLRFLLEGTELSAPLSLLAGDGLTLLLRSETLETPDVNHPEGEYPRGGEWLRLLDSNQ